MDASSAQHQEMSTNSLESVLVCTKTQQDQKKPRPQPEQALKCPRCESTNTKFCYYNNYSLSQPRYFCKSCRRYWTKGGTLRNVPVGGGCRKNKRSSSSSSSSSSRRVQDHPNSNPLSPFQHLPYDSNDLTLAFSRLHKGQLGFDHQGHDLSIFGSNQHNGPQLEILGNPSNLSASSGLFDALRSGFLDTQNGFQNLYSSGFDQNGNLMGNNGSSTTVSASGEMVLPYEDMTTSAATTVTTVKQEMCNNNFTRESENSRVLWGFPWQVNADGNMGDLASSSWHGILNSPLM